MSLYAANNIHKAVENFKDRGYAQVKGLILNRRNIEREYEKVQEFADQSHLPIIADIPRSGEIQRCEELGKTVVEDDPTLQLSKIYIDLAKKIMED